MNQLTRAFSNEAPRARRLLCTSTVGVLLLLAQHAQAQENTAPFIATTPPPSVDQGSLYTYTINAVDLDPLDSLTYTAPTRPACRSVRTR